MNSTVSSSSYASDSMTQLGEVLMGPLADRTIVNHDTSPPPKSTPIVVLATSKKAARVGVELIQYYVLTLL